MPVDFAVGGTLEAFNHLAHRIIVSLETASDIISLKKIPFRLNSGMEYSFRNFIFLRGGYRYGYSFNGFSGGGGIKINYSLSKIVLLKKYELSSIDFDLSYAVVPYGDFGFNHYFMINFANIRIKTGADDIEEILE